MTPTLTTEATQAQDKQDERRIVAGAVLILCLVLAVSFDREEGGFDFSRCEHVCAPAHALEPSKHRNQLRGRHS